MVLRIVSWEIGEYQKGLDFANQALALQKQAEASLSGAALGSNLINQAKILAGIAKVYTPFALGEPEKALDYYNQGLLLVRQTGDRNLQSTISIVANFRRSH